MRKILSVSTSISLQNLSLRNLNGLTFKSAYYARYTKRTGKNSNQQQNPSEGSNQNQPNSENQQENNDHMNPQEPGKDSKITGPKKLLSMLKSGNSKILPFYLNNMIRNTRNPSLPGYEDYVFNESEQKQGTNTTKDSQSVKQSQKQRQQQVQAKKIYEYYIKSSTVYRQKLLKKYKIIQSLKSTTKANSSPAFSFNFSSMFESIKTEGLVKMLQDNFGKGQVYRVSALAAVIILFAFMMFSSVETVPNTIEYFQKNTELSDSDIQSKVNQIKEIRIKTKFIFGSVRQNTLTVVMKEQRKLSLFEQLLDSLGFAVEKNKTFTFDAKNPNLILDGLQKAQQHKEHSDWIKIKPIIKAYTMKEALWDTLMLATPFIGIYITYWIFTKVNPESMMKGITSNKKSMKIQSTKDIKVRFKDVAGMENAKKEITEFVDFLKNSQKYVEMGAKIPKGALLTGPPGTGKTMLAKACAGEAGTSFFYVSGSEFVQMFVGLGASRVRELFAKARQEAPSIIFIDEIDAIGKKRETSRNEQKDSTLNQMLVEMDGFSTSETVIVLAATNRKDILDSALTRPGRFDRMVEITLPELKAREEIFMVHLTPLKVNPNKPLSEIAQRLASLTPGFSGADIANLCNEAAIIATRKKRQFIEDADFEEASQRIMAGYVKKGLSNEKTKKRVAYHEAGHAVCGWYLRGGDPLVKLTIIPRSKGALGYAQYLPKTAYIRTKSQIIDQISIMLGGTTSEQVFLGDMSSGNSDDLQKVYGLARRMVTQFGMGARTYNLTLDEQTYVKKESEKLCNLMDEEMLQIVNQATVRAKKIIEEKREIVEQLAKQLLQKQTLNNEDILRIMGQRPAFN